MDHILLNLQLTPQSQRLLFSSQQPFIRKSLIYIKVNNNRPKSKQMIGRRFYRVRGELQRRIKKSSPISPWRMLIGIGAYSTCFVE